MRRWPRHSQGYHEWESTTPVIDAIAAIAAAASVVIGGYAALFLVLALQDGDFETAADCSVFLIVIAIANRFVDGLRNWRRHHS